TYRFPKGMSDREFLRRSYQMMTRFLEEAWVERDKNIPLKTPYEALILASIIEKETGKASERPEIAGVFIRRLKKRMRLQTDPTVIYGLGDSFDGNIKRRHLTEDTPYNTYTRRGLPPTPIAMPGREAILAALHPAAGDAIYFVSKGDGSHYFSATLNEHNNAVIKYQLKGRKKTFSSYNGK
ncbi:MAG: endolytic transglycosylase MltG, partial [Chromatiales bacterium]|nr:endolytic transglycosylase MltG [Chromatiales bacterium]